MEQRKGVMEGRRRVGGGYERKERGMEGGREGRREGV